MIYLQIVAGFVLLIGAAELMVRGAVMLAERFGVSPLVIGMTVVAIGTSAPELVVSVRAAFQGAPGLAVGNVVGSNIANVLLILGAAAMISPFQRSEGGLKRDSVILIGGTLLFIVLALRGELDTYAGAALLVGFFAFLGLSYWRESHDPGEAEEAEETIKEFEGWPKSLAGEIVAVVAGLVGLAAGAELLITGGVQVARTWGVSEEVIGLTLFAFGTSLPELAATIVAAWRGHGEVGIGNVLGSNVFNILGVAGVTAVLVPLPISDKVMAFDTWVMLAAALAMVPLVAFGWRLSRLAGAAMFAAYIGYVWLQARGVEGLVG
ncbi:MAG: calcium/sodium antiporter [Rhodospirillaceae bacterium]